MLRFSEHMSYISVGMKFGNQCSFSIFCAVLLIVDGLEFCIDSCCGYSTVNMSQDITRSYNSQALIAVGRDMTFHGVQADVWRTLSDLGIAARKSTKRDRRGGVKGRRGIAVNCQQIPLSYDNQSVSLCAKSTQRMQQNVRYLRSHSRT